MFGSEKRSPLGPVKNTLAEKGEGEGVHWPMWWTGGLFTYVYIHTRIHTHKRRNRREGRSMRVTRYGYRFSPFVGEEGRKGHGANKLDMDRVWAAAFCPHGQNRQTKR